MARSVRRRVPVIVPTGTSGLSEPFKSEGYRLSALHMPSVWAAAAVTLQAAVEEPVRANHVFDNGTAAGLAVDDGGAQDIQTTNAVQIVVGDQRHSVAASAALDISALLSAAATINTSAHGILWVFANRHGTYDVEVATSPANETSAIAAWAQWAVTERLLPPAPGMVPIGAVHVEEGGSGAFTWGTDSITAETEAYHDFLCLPEMLNPVASLALDAAAATFTYGAGTARLGTAARISLSGKVNVAISGSNIADGNTGAFLLYALADDSEIAQQFGISYPNLAAARAAVEQHKKNPNPMLALFGVLYIANASGGNFVPGTTNLDAAGITATFDIEQPRFQDVYDDAGTEISITAAAGHNVQLAGDTKEQLMGAHSYRLRSGTSGTPVDQTTSPTVQVVLEEA